MGFSSGGDDYLPKPFSYQELISRVKALVRRYHVYQGSGRRTQEEKMCSGALEVYPEAGTVWKNGKEISLTDTEFSILCTLMKHRKQIFLWNTCMRRYGKKLIITGRQILLWYISGI